MTSHEYAKELRKNAEYLLSRPAFVVNDAPITYPKVLVAEDIREFVDKHVKELLSSTEQGKEFLKENPGGPPSTC